MNKSVQIVMVSAGRAMQLTAKMLDWFDKFGIPVRIVCNNCTSFPEHSNVEVIRTPPDVPFNYSRANNIGMEGVTSEFAVFVNDDMDIIDDTWLEKLLKAFDDPDVEVAGPVLLEPNRSVQRAGIYPVAHTLDAPRIVTPPFAINFKPGPGIQEVCALGGACQAVRTASFNGFDEDMPISCSDDVLGLTARKCVLVNESRIVHYQSSSGTMREYASTVVKDINTLWRKYWPWILGKGKYNLTSQPIWPNCINKDKIRKVAIVKTDHIGDWAISLYGLETIKRTFPKAEFTVFCASWAMDLAKKAGFENLVALDYRGFGGCASGIIPVHPDQIMALASKSFDLAINLRVDDSDLPVMDKIDAPLKLGFFKGSFVNLSITPKQNLYQVVDMLIQSIPAVSPKFTYKNRAITVYIHPFASIPEKQYPFDKFMSIGKFFMDRGVDVKWIFPDEMSKKRFSPSRGECLPVMPLTDMLDRVREDHAVYIGCDSGPTHWVAMEGTPTLMLMSNIREPHELVPLTMNSAGVYAGVYNGHGFYQIPPMDVIHMISHIYLNSLRNQAE